MIGMRYIANPVGASLNTGVTLTSGLAITTTRIGLGAFPLAIAIFCFTCLLSAKRLRAGVSLVATVLTTAIAVRLQSIATDGVVAQSVRLFIPEGVILVLAMSGLLLETARQRQARGEVA
jgi:hypothetical protein